MSTTPKAKARELLELHAAYEESVTREPGLDESGNPLDETAWLDWHMNDYLPHANRMRTARGELEELLGSDVPSHPWSFVPLCKAIILVGEAHE